MDTFSLVVSEQELASIVSAVEQQAKAYEKLALVCALPHMKQRFTDTASTLRDLSIRLNIDAIVTN